MYHLTHSSIYLSVISPLLSFSIIFLRLFIPISFFPPSSSFMHILFSSASFFRLYPRLLFFFINSFIPLYLYSQVQITYLCLLSLSNYAFHLFKYICLFTYNCLPLYSGIYQCAKLPACQFTCIPLNLYIHTNEPCIFSWYLP